MSANPNCATRKAAKDVKALGLTLVVAAEKEEDEVLVLVLVVVVVVVVVAVLISTKYRIKAFCNVVKVVSMDAQGGDKSTVHKNPAGGDDKMCFNRVSLLVLLLLLS